MLKKPGATIYSTMYSLFLPDENDRMKITRNISLFLIILNMSLAMSFVSYSQVNTTQRMPDNTSQARFAFTPPNGPPDPCTDPRLPCPIDDGVLLLIAAGIGLGALKASRGIRSGELIVTS
jgi:hypothetical protein